MSQSDVLVSEIWPEKYRPQTLPEAALWPEVRSEIEALMKMGTPFSSIFYGPSGTGKTTIAKILAESFDEHLIVNAAEARSVDFIKTRVLPWMKASGGIFRIANGGNWRGVVVFGEADGLSEEAQSALHEAMETYASSMTVLFTTNHLDKLSKPILDRCKRIELLPPPLDEKIRILETVLILEQVPTDRLRIAAFARCFPGSMRELLREAQFSVVKHRELKAPSLAELKCDLWSEPVDGAQVLDEIVAEFKKYVSLPDMAAETIALWAAFAHGHPYFRTLPLLVFMSPLKASGKTTAMELLSRFVPNPESGSHFTAASIFHLPPPPAKDATDASVYDLPTLMGDEAEHYVRHGDGILLAVLNSGHIRGIFAYVRRANKKFRTDFPKCVALIDRGTLPGPTLSRSILINMRRRRADEVVAPFRSDLELPAHTVLRRKLARFIADSVDRLRNADPIMPVGVEDRLADNWRPLLAIADAPGGGWPALARKACVTISNVGDVTLELQERMIDALEEIVLTDPSKPDRYPSEILVERMLEYEHEPWKDLNEEKLAKFFRRFGVRVDNIWASKRGGPKGTFRGYWVKDLTALFERYGSRHRK